jgi:hypothetical protein
VVLELLTNATAECERSLREYHEIFIDFLRESAEDLKNQNAALKRLVEQQNSFQVCNTNCSCHGARRGWRVGQLLCT